MGIVAKSSLSQLSWNLGGVASRRFSRWDDLVRINVKLPL